MGRSSPRAILYAFVAAVFAWAGATLVEAASGSFFTAMAVAKKAVMFPICATIVGVFYTTWMMRPHKNKVWL